MAAKSKDSLQKSLAGIAAAHAVFGLLVAFQIIAYDAWALITPDAVSRRWAALFLFISIVMTVWIRASRRRAVSAQMAERLLWLLIVADIAMTSFGVYTQRGMAARAVALYAIPILISALLSRATMIFLTAALCAVSYIITAVSYFVLNFNEGYKIELYGEVGFYSLFFVLLAALTWAVARPKKW